MHQERKMLSPKSINIQAHINNVDPTFGSETRIQGLSSTNPTTWQQQIHYPEHYATSQHSILRHHKNTNPQIKHNKLPPIKSNLSPSPSHSHSHSHIQPSKLQPITLNSKSTKTILIFHTCIKQQKEKPIRSPKHAKSAFPTNPTIHIHPYPESSSHTKHHHMNNHKTTIIEEISKSTSTRSNKNETLNQPENGGYTWRIRWRIRN